MQIVTFNSSASGTICFSAAAQLSKPTAGSIPRALPLKVMTFRQPSAAVALILASSFARQAS